MEIGIRQQSGEGFKCADTVPPGVQFSPECVPCLLNRVLFETGLVDEGKQAETMRSSLRILASEYRPGMNSAALATKVHREAYRIVGSSDPYAELKRRSDAVAEALFPRAKRMVEASPDRLRTAALCAIAGNVLDFGIDIGLERPEDLSVMFDSLVADGLAVDDLAKMKEIASRSDRILYLLDNCGEVVFDRLLVAELQALGPKVIGVVKGEPILTDVTLADAKRSGIDQVFDRVLSTDSFAVGVDPSKIGLELRHELETAELIVAKGMANFESLSDERFGPIAYLLRAKCGPVARAIGARRNDNVVRAVDRAT
jgi:uncharacterized protein with ATP-grasp and redox domains